jgi:glucose-1-phosphate cytidylyltransferase
MKVVILCGGQGTRLREQTEVLPKPMVEIGGRPMVWHIMKSYAHYGLNEFVLCLGYKGHVIKDYFLNYELRTNDLTVDLGSGKASMADRRHSEADWRVSLVETGERAMTGARVFRIRDYVGNEPFCLTYGDGLGNVDIASLLSFHRQHGKMVTVTGVRPPGRFGELELDGNRVRAFAEKPQVTESFINGGFFVIEPGFFDRYLSDDDELTLEREPLQNAAADGEMMMFPHTGFWQCMDTFREWKMLEEMWENNTAEWRVW